LKKYFNIQLSLIFGIALALQAIPETLRTSVFRTIDSISKAYSKLKAYIYNDICLPVACFKIRNYFESKVISYKQFSFDDFIERKLREIKVVKWRWHKDIVFVTSMTKSILKKRIEEDLPRKLDETLESFNNYITSLKNAKGAKLTYNVVFIAFLILLLPYVSYAGGGSSEVNPIYGQILNALLITFYIFQMRENHILGDISRLFKWAILGILIINTICFYTLTPYVLGWMILVEFIFMLMLALKCYPLQSGGLIAIQSLLLGLTTAKHVFTEVEHNLSVVLLLVFMVAGIYFMKPLIMFIFSKIFIKIKRKWLLSLLFAFLGAVLSAFLDALTVTAVLISVAVGFFGVYKKVSSNLDLNNDGIKDKTQLDAEFEQFKSFLRSLVMHGVVGTALGGVCTQVGEPQNLIIANTMGWDFMQFFSEMSSVTMPVLFCGLIATIGLEKISFMGNFFGYGAKLPTVAREIIEKDTENKHSELTDKDKYDLKIQTIGGILLILALAFHVAEVGFIGLGLIIFLTFFMGIIDEHSLGPAFEEGLPFTALLMVFFVIVAVITDQNLFGFVIDYAFSLEDEKQIRFFYLSTGGLSMISDNVFVATVFMGEVSEYFGDSVDIKHAEFDPAKRELFEKIAVAINTGTNLPSVATPNGQAAFLFLLTSKLAPKINLSYLKMFWMAVPYTFVLGGIGLLGIMYFL